MPLWRCPHCATPQAEASRCWVCRRSTTSCASCRHFRRGVTSGLGFCGLDRSRLALRGDEIRGCWTAAPDTAADDVAPVAAGIPGDGGGSGLPAGRRPRTFVPVEELEGRPPAPTGVPRPGVPPPAAPPLHATAAERPRWSLWGDIEA